TAFAIPSVASLGWITTAPGGDVWFTEGAGQVGRLTPQGVLSEYELATTATLDNLTSGPDGSLWYTRFYTPDAVGRVDLSALPESTGVILVPAQTNAGVQTGTITPTTQKLEVYTGETGIEDSGGASGPGEAPLSSQTTTLAATSGGIQLAAGPTQRFLSRVYQELLHRPLDSV